MSQPYSQPDYQNQEERQYYDEQMESAEEKDEKPDEPPLTKWGEIKELIRQLIRYYRLKRVARLLKLIARSLDK